MTVKGDIGERVEQLKDYINNGKILEAMTEFYDENVAMQENSEPPTEGLAANIEREKQFLANVKQWNWTKWHATAVNEAENVAFIEYSFEFVSTDDQTVVYEQATVQRWQNGKIISERFYHG